MLCIEIGNYHIKIGEYDKKERLLKNKIIVKIPINCIKNGEIVDVDTLSEYINSIIEDKHIKKKNLSFSISSNDIIIREISMPTMKEEELKSALQYEIDQYIPDIDDYVIDHKILGKLSDKDKNIRVLLVAAPKKIIDGYVKLSDMLHLQLDVIDVYNNCLYKALKRLCKIEGVTAVIDIGALYTNVTILDRSNYVFGRMILFGGNELTQIIANTYNIDIKTAEAYKRTKPFLNGTEKENIENIIAIPLRDINRVFDFYTSTHNKGIDKIYLIGGTSMLVGLSEYIEDYFKIPVTTFDDDDYIYYLPILGCQIRGE
jgi:type IV pilus assembly protein PilM